MSFDDRFKERLLSELGRIGTAIEVQAYYAIETRIETLTRSTRSKADQGNIKFYTILLENLRTRIRTDLMF